MMFVSSKYGIIYLAKGELCFTIEEDKRGGDAGMKMRYVSNAGIIFEKNGIHIGIDCFCKDEYGIYPDLEEGLKEELLNGIEDGILSVLIFTHEHSDHFCAEDVKAACDRNSELQIWSGKSVLQSLKEVGVPSEQLQEVYPSQTYEIGQTMEIQFLQTLHDGDQYAHIQNLTVLINIGKKSIAVTGDAMPRKELFQEIARWNKKVDWLVAPFPYVGLRTARRAINDSLEIRDIFVLHQPKEDTQKWVENAKNMCEQAQDKLPYPIFPNGTGEWYEI